MQPTPLDAYSLALRRLSIREYGQAELKRYLKKKGIPTEEADRAIQKLLVDGILNEQRYILAVIRSQTTRGKGPAYIRQKLQEKGVSVSTKEIQSLMSGALAEDETEMIRKLIDRRYPGAYEDSKAYYRAFQALLRRGFSPSTIQKVLRLKNSERI